jgi:hypothetical protein
MAQGAHIEVFAPYKVDHVSHKGAQDLEQDHDCAASLYDGNDVADGDEKSAFHYFS